VVLELRNMGEWAHRPSPHRRVLSSGIWCHVVRSLLMFCRTYCLYLYDQSASLVRNQWDILLIACLAYTLTPKIKAVHSSKPLVNFCQTVQGDIPEDCTLPSYYCENLRPSSPFLLTQCVCVCVHVCVMQRMHSNEWQWRFAEFTFCDWWIWI
jgi:hypothetical protein